MGFLMRFPEYVAFRSRVRRENGQEALPEAAEKSPEEMLELSYQSLRSTLAQDILERVKRCSPRFFEGLVVDLLVSMGYGGSRRDPGQAIGRSGDGGID